MHVHVVVVQKRAEKCTKKRHARAKLLFCQYYCFFDVLVTTASLDLKVPEITSFARYSCTVAYQELHLRAVRSGVLREQTSLPQQYRDD